MCELVPISFETVIALVLVLIRVAVLGSMAPCTQSTHLGLLATSVVLLEVSQFLASIAPLDEKAVIDRARAKTYAKSVTISFDSRSGVLRHSQNCLEVPVLVFHWSRKQYLGIVFSKGYATVLILLMQDSEQLGIIILPGYEGN